MSNAAWRLEEDIEDFGAELAVDTRTTGRANVYLSVDVFSGYDFWTGFTMNMSKDGVFIATDNARSRVGSTVVLNIALPFANDAVVVLAEVRWVRHYVEGAPAGIGLAFLNPSGGALAKISRFVEGVGGPLDFLS